MKVRYISFTATSILLAATWAQATMFSVNFTGRGPAAEEDLKINEGSSIGQTAGVNGATTWNDVLASGGNPNGTDVPITGDAGQTATISFQASGSWGNNLGSDANNSLMNGFIMSNDHASNYASNRYTFTVSGLADDFPSGYDIYLYVGAEAGKDGDEGTLQLSQDGGDVLQSRPYKATVFDGSSFPLVKGAGFATGNLIIFSGIFGDSATVSFDHEGGDIESALAGFQIVPFTFKPSITQINKASGETMAITFSTTPGGESYFVQKTANIETPLWTDASPALTASPSNIVTYMDSTAFSPNFYRIKMLAGPALFEEDFENGLNGWSIAATGSTTSWEIGSPATSSSTSPVTEAHSPSNCAGTDLNGAYDDGAESTLTSPNITITGSSQATLSFYEMSWTEQYDILKVNILDQGGSVVSNLYTFGIEYPTGQGFDSVIESWTKRELALPLSELPSPFKIQFYFQSDNFNSEEYTGWYIDDVIIN